MLRGRAPANAREIVADNVADILTALQCARPGGIAAVTSDISARIAGNQLAGVEIAPGTGARVRMAYNRFTQPEFGAPPAAAAKAITAYRVY